MQKVLKDTVKITSLFCAGEYIAKKYIEKKSVHEQKDSIKRTALWSVAMGPIISKWYTWLDTSYKSTKFGKFILNRWPAVPAALIASKAILDVVADAPFYGAHIAVHHYDDKDYKFIDNFINMYKTDILFWTPANFINFFLVSPQNRVLFYSSAVFIWSIILPIICSEKQHHQSNACE